eukprot:3305009-Rhodomonas_salina.1
MSPATSVSNWRRWTLLANVPGPTAVVADDVRVGDASKGREGCLRQLMHQVVELRLRVESDSGWCLRGDLRASQRCIIGFALELLLLRVDVQLELAPAHLLLVFLVDVAPADSFNRPLHDLGIVRRSLGSLELIDERRHEHFVDGALRLRGQKMVLHKSDV